MDEKLRRLMKHEGINSTRLAEILGIQASGISHIMSGRNKPSYDFLLKLLQRFPQINPDWLLLDKGPMYRNEIKSGGGGNPRTAPGPGVPGVIHAAAPGTGGTSEYQGAGAGHSPASVVRDTTAAYNASTGGGERGTFGANPSIIPVASAGGGPAAPAQRNIFEPDNNDVIPTGRSGQQPPNTAMADFPATPSAGGFARSSSIERIVVFYKDKTFSEYRPE